MSLLVATGKTRTVTDSITFADTVTRAALARARSIADAVTFADAVARALAQQRTRTDAISLSESLLVATGKTRTISDALHVADGVTRGPVAAVRAVTGTITLADSAGRVLTLTPRSIADALAFTEQLAAGAVAAIEFPDGVGGALVFDVAGGGTGLDVISDSGDLLEAAASVLVLEPVGASESG